MTITGFVKMIRDSKGKFVWNKYEDTEEAAYRD